MIKKWWPAALWSSVETLLPVPDLLFGGFAGMIVKVSLSQEYESFDFSGSVN